MVDWGLQRVWGEANAFLDRSRRYGWADVLVVAGIAGLALGAIGFTEEWTSRLHPAVQIDLSPAALPRYALFSLARGLLAYGFSLAFTLVYGYWAARDRVAQRLLIPLLDILQSIPVLGFMPGLVLALVMLFPHSNVGLELAAVLMIFTGQVWNMTFSFYNSLRAVPDDLREAGSIYRYSWWQRLQWVELPHATVGLVWNSMMSMAGGWFFLMISEAFVLGKHDFRLPGLGSYMSVAVAHGDVRAMVLAVGTMGLMILVLDQLLWRPLVVWSRRFRVEESAEAETTGSWFLDLLRRSRLIRRLRRAARRPAQASGAGTHAVLAPAKPRGTGPSAGSRALSYASFAALAGVLTLGAWKLLQLVHHVPLERWLAVSGASLLTLARVLASTALGTLWALPAGLAIGLSARASRVFQPVIQFAASFPAPMLFPAAIALLHAAGVPLGWGSILLMLLGTQWYILFNVIAGASAIPTDLREAAQTYRLRGLQRARDLYLPGVFPYLVTGWVTAAGGAWNASIVSEYVAFEGHTLTTPGVGTQISLAAERGDYAGLAASVLVMSTLVVLFNRTVWRQCSRLAEERFALNR
jgi:NitT/TauT family transport system permease protein